MEDVKQELEHLFEYRDKIVHEASKRIFIKIGHVLRGIDVFLSKTDKAYSNGTMSWEDVQYVEDNNIVVVFGVLSFVPGSRFDLGGKIIEITESNADSFQRMVRIGIPIGLASEGTESQVINFLGGIEQQHESLDENNVRNLASELPNLPRKRREDFDWDKLTDEQKNALVIGNVSQKPS
jgi:hypothetical protein